MHLSAIDLNLFVVFETIYAEGGITRASQRLHLSQPALSHALARLRQLFDDPLFTRRGHAMTPTPLARRMIEPVRASLRQLEVTLDKADAFDPARARKRFVVGMRDELEAALLPALLRALATTAPGVDLSTVRAERRELEGELAAGTLDAAIDVPLPLPPEIRRHRLSAERLVVVARARHPKLRRGLDLERYLALDHVAVSTRRRGLTVEDFELGRRDLRRRIRLRCQHHVAAVQVACATDLVLTMSERYARLLTRHEAVRLHPFPLTIPAFDAYLYWHADAETYPSNAWLRAQIRAALDARAGRRHAAAAGRGAARSGTAEGTSR